jgi:hypothetical protein
MSRAAAGLIASAIAAARKSLSIVVALLQGTAPHSKARACSISWAQRSQSLRSSRSSIAVRADFD